MDESLAVRRPFQFPLQPADLFAERAGQMRTWGIPARAIERVRGDVREMWLDGPGGWAYEWMREAEAAERAGRPLAAAMLYGAARFPCVSDALQGEAYARQLQLFERAARRFPCYFERRVVQVPYRGGTTPVVAHFYAAFWHGRDHWQKLPLIVLSGGTSTWKVELHRRALGLTIAGNFLVVAIDMPGTGESAVPLAGDAEDLYLGVARDFAHDLGGERPLAAFGFGFGGLWAARLAARGLVDAAVAGGAPIGVEPAELAALPIAEAGPLAHALGLAGLPDAADLPGLLAPFAWPGGGLADATAPLLVFDRAGDRRGRVTPAAIAWLRARLHGRSVLNRLALRAAAGWLPRRR